MGATFSSIRQTSQVSVMPPKFSWKRLNDMLLLGGKSELLRCATIIGEKFAGNRVNGHEFGRCRRWSHAILADPSRPKTAAERKTFERCRFQPIVPAEEKLPLSETPQLSLNGDGDLSSRKRLGLPASIYRSGICCQITSWMLTSWDSEFQPHSTNQKRKEKKQ
jgi:hypothetical protein